MYMLQAGFLLSGLTKFKIFSGFSRGTVILQGFAGPVEPCTHTDFTVQQKQVTTTTKITINILS